MGYITQGDLVQQMTPEQRILVSGFYTKFDIGSGVAHKKILNVEPLFYQGALAGSEFVTYVNTKLYLFLSLWGDTESIDTADEPFLRLYDEANSDFFDIASVGFSLNGVGAIIAHWNTKEFTDGYFSRLSTDAAQPIKNIKFIGYRITLT